MKKVLILSLALLVSASMAFAQSGGHVGLYSDSPTYADCHIVEGATTPMNVYLVHSLRLDANTAQLKVQNNWSSFPGAVNFGTNLWINSTPGNSLYEGGTITYGGCRTLPWLLATMQFFFGGVPTADCTEVLQVVPDPTLASGQIEIVLCDETTIVYATGGVLYTNNGGSDQCPCEVATEETSWSRIKAMYQ
jgi:hypothetical protein